MTNEQIEKAKNDYAQSIIDSFGRSGVPCGISNIRLMIADGFKAGATEALASQWKDPKVELPEIPDGKKLIRVLAWVGDEPLVCWYTCHGRFITTLAAKEKYSYDSLKDVKIHLSSEREDVTEIVTAWLPIPPLKGGDV